MRKPLFASLCLLLFALSGRAEFRIDGIPFHTTPMERRLVLHPVAGECDFRGTATLNSASG